MRLIIVCAVTTALLVGCNQQAEADLATCKSDLTKAQSEAMAAKTTADQKVAALETQLKQAQDQLAANQKATDDAAKAADDKAMADKAASDKATAAGKATAQKKSAELKQAVEKADVKTETQTKDATTQQKAKAAGF